MLEPWFENTLGEPGYRGQTLPVKYKVLKESGIIDKIKATSEDKDFLKSVETFYIENDKLESIQTYIEHR